MAYLYKRSNRIWHFLIRHRLTAGVWRPLIAMSRWRHLRFRKHLAGQGADHWAWGTSTPLPAGV